MSYTASITIYNSCLNPVTIFVGNYNTYSDYPQNQYGSQIAVSESYTFNISFIYNAEEPNFLEIVTLESNNYNLYQLISINGNYGQLNAGTTTYFNLVEGTINFFVVDITTVQNAHYTNTQYGVTDMIDLYIISKTVNSFVTTDCMTGSCSTNFTQLSTPSSSVGCICINNDGIKNNTNLKIISNFSGNITLYIGQVQSVSGNIVAIGNTPSYELQSKQSISLILSPVTSASGLILVYYDSKNMVYGIYPLVSFTTYVVNDKYTFTLQDTQGELKSVPIADSLTLQYFSNNISSYINPVPPCSAGYIQMGTTPDTMCINLSEIYNTNSSSFNYWILIGIIAFILILVVIGVIIYLVVKNKKKNKPKNKSKSKPDNVQEIEGEEPPKTDTTDSTKVDTTDPSKVDTTEPSKVDSL